MDAPVRERGIAGMIGRGIWVLIAFAVAALVGLVLLVVVGGMRAAERLGDGPPVGDPDYDTLLHYFDLVFGGAHFVVAVVPILSILPALAVILVGEVARLRGLLYYLVGGGISAVLLPLLASPAGTAFDARMLSVFATAGFAGGLVYWLLAGRRA